VLVCDDELQILRALRVLLRDARFDVTTAATAQEALDSAAVGPVEAAIIDLLLPGGVEVCRSIREWSDMPIIVLSAVGEEEQKVRALEAGADDYSRSHSGRTSSSRGCARRFGARAPSQPKSPRCARTESS
jgi:two-component system, OmpR family, KDP operon response regulator KdpE